LHQEGTFAIIISGLLFAAGLSAYAANNFVDGVWATALEVLSAALLGILGLEVFWVAYYSPKVQAPGTQVNRFYCLQSCCLV
jgi:hypothetical protein